MHDDSLDVYQEITYDNSIVSITKQSGEIITANKRFCEISGYSEEELVGSNHNIVNSGYHSKDFFKEMWVCLLEGRVWKGEICNRAKNGQLYWVDTIIRPVWCEENNEYNYISIRLEVTHRKKFEEVLASVQDVAKIGYWEWNVQTNHLYWSSMVYEIHGLDPLEFVPTVENTIELYAEHFRDIVASRLKHTLETGEIYDLELQILHKSGELIWTRGVGKVEKVNGLPYRIYGTFQDIDKEKKLSINLNRPKVHLTMAVESAGIGNWVYIPSKDHLTWDDLSYDIFGVNKEKFNSSIEDWMNCLEPKDREVASKDFLTCISEKKPIYNSQFNIIHPQKGLRCIKGRALIEYNHLGEPTEITGLNWDITEEVKNEKILIEAREKALDATQAKSSFLASMSHEIRTPMNGMMGMLELLTGTKLNREQKDLVETIQTCGDQLLTIVNDILDFSKIEAGKMDLEYRSFDLRKVIKGTKSIFNAEASRKGLVIRTVIDPALPQFIVGDETRLKQILSNLVSNALKFTEKGHISIEVIFDKMRSNENQGNFIFKVVDTGMGIPLEKQGILFQSFRQVDETTTRKFGGTGLGLAICQSLVNKMGGQIAIESDLGSGSTFYFEVMAEIGYELESEEDVVPIDHRGYRKDLKILLAEDHKTNQKLAISFLKKLGFSKDRIFVANNGEEAVSLVDMCIKEEDPFDVVFMDMQMPVMDGLDATKNIICNWQDSAPPIIAMTANVFEEDRQKCFNAGMKAFIAKPISKRALEDQFRRFFGLDDMSDIENEKREEEMRSFNYIDSSKILYEFREDMDIFEEMLSDYKEQINSFVEQIQNGTKTKNAEEIQIAGHTLKGIVGNFYSDKLRDAAFRIEECGKNAYFIDTEEKLGIFLSINELVLKELEEFVSEQNNLNQAA